MKKLFMIILLACSLNMSAQISNLSELLEFSEFSVLQLTNYLQYDWELSRPVENIENGIAVGKYTYNLDDEGYIQILQREIRKDLNTGFTLESTRLTSNDREFYDALLIQLKSMGFVLKFERKRDGALFYSRGSDKLIIYPKGNEEVILSDGFFLISIPRNNAD